MSEKKNRNRLVEIDALRGLAAMAVVLYHYTTWYVDLYHPLTLPTLSFPDGHYGVNLFFIISGFVIFMTLEKTSRPTDFVVSRFSRLFPAYWVAIVLTYTITHMLGLPDRLVSMSSAFGNLMMIHHLFGVPHVDGVYWTLEVELLFYCGMFLLYRCGHLHMIHQVLLGLLALRLTYFALERGFGIDLPWTISRLLILKYIPWFALGISIYQVTSRERADGWQGPAFTAACAIFALLIVDSLFLAVLAVALGAAVFLAASGRAPVLRHRILVWLGSISYTLYLLHQNIGWSLELQLQASGISTDASILLALVVSLAMATALTRWVEQPAMRWIRKTYRNRLAVA